MYRTILLILIGCLGLSIMAQPARAQTELPAEVMRMSSTLNLRSAPDRDASILAELSGGTPLLALSRSRDGAWLQLRTQDGIVGWAAQGFIALQGDFASLPIAGLEPAPAAEAPAPDSPSPAAAENTAQDEAMARVAPDVQLNLRSAPNARATLLQRLQPDTHLTLLGRNADSTWLQVEVSGQSGWVAAAYVRSSIDYASLPTNESAPSAVAASGAAVSASGIEIGAATLRIFQRGQQLGRRVGAFSKIGDSMTVDGLMYSPIGAGAARLGDYAYLQAVLNTYLPVDVRAGNAFSNPSLAAGNGWTSATLLDPSAANSAICQPGETPLACEYRTVNPAIALIMIGSNDLVALSTDAYRANLQQIVAYSIEQGIVPALSTIPTRMAHEARSAEFNQIIVDTARANGLPLWDYGGAMRALADQGLSGDGLHPSAHPGGFAYAADFTGDHLKYGYVLRNLYAMQMLYAFLVQVQAI